MSPPEDVVDARARGPVAGKLLLILAVVAAIVVARSFLLPVVFAVFFKVVLTPLLRVLRGLGLPAPLGALVLVGLITAVVSIGAAHLVDPAVGWLRQLPPALQTLKEELGASDGPLQQATELTKEIEEITSERTESALRVEIAERRRPFEALLGIGEAGIQVVSTLFLLLLLLAADQSLLRGIVEVTPRFRDKRLAVEAFRGIERRISRYLLTTILINAGLGAAVGAVLGALGFPNPVLWGVLVAGLNFVPYIGAGVGVLTVTCASLSLDSENLARALLAPAAYFGLNSLEGLVITPMILGRAMLLSPVAVVISVMFWSWAWGAGGAVLAVPILLTVMLVFETVPSLEPLARLLADRRPLESTA